MKFFAESTGFTYSNWEPRGWARYRKFPDVIDLAHLLACIVVCCSHRSDHQSNSTSTLRSISCHILVNNLHFITYSTRIIQKKKKILKKFKWNWVLLFSKITLLYCMRSMPVSHFECFRPRSSRLSFLGLWIFCFVWFINKFDLSWQLRPTVFEDI